MTKTMLNAAINGREVICTVHGQYAPADKRSNLYDAIVRAGFTPADIGTKIDVAIGAHRRNYSDGWEMAIVRF